MLNPPISRMGGKSKLRRTIIDMMPKHTCYVELFFGAGMENINMISSAKEEKAIEIAKNLLDILDIETIAIKTGLSAEDVKKLKH